MCAGARFGGYIMADGCVLSAFFVCMRFCMAADGVWNGGCIKKQKIRSRVLNIRREKCGKNASERTDGLYGPKNVNFDKIGNTL